MPVPREMFVGLLTMRFGPLDAAIYLFLGL